MIKIRYRIAAGIMAIIVSFACTFGAPLGNSDTDNGTGLPDGKITSITKKGNGRTIEICVRSESTGSIKCKDFTKAEVSGCHEGDFWPDCYHLPVRRADA